MEQLKKKVAVITGAGAGIGRALSLEFLSRGTNVALLDINEDHLQETASLARGAKGKATYHPVDVSDRIAIEKLADEIFQLHGGIDILINNAGVNVEWASVTNISWEHWEWVMNTNFWGTLHCIKYFLPYLERQEEAHIVNVSSILSMISSGDRGAYCTSKFATRGLTECLMQELRGTHINVTIAIPGGVRTNFIRNSKGWEDPIKQNYVASLAQKSNFTSPELVAQKIIQAIMTNRKRVLIGLDAKILDRLARYFPVLSNLIMPILVSKTEERLASKVKEEASF